MSPKQARVAWCVCGSVRISCGNVMEEGKFCLNDSLQCVGMTGCEYDFKIIVECYVVQEVNLGLGLSKCFEGGSV